MSSSQSCPIIWKWLDPVEPNEVDRILEDYEINHLLLRFITILASYADLDGAVWLNPCDCEFVFEREVISSFHQAIPRSDCVAKDLVSLLGLRLWRRHLNMS